MILYVNGDSHSGGCEAVVPECFLEDDWLYYSKNIDPTLLAIWQDEIKCAPPPENINVSYGKIVSDNIGAKLHCHARGAGSNDRIIRTTKEYLKNNNPDIILIGWSTWEREEWWNEDDNTWYQVNASAQDSVPKKWEQRYKEFVINVNWEEKTLDAHEKIWQFHQYLNEKRITHLFFNSHSSFHSIKNQCDWGNNYIRPYDHWSYCSFLTDECNLPRPANNHFGPDGHAKWAEYIMPYLTRLL